VGIRYVFNVFGDSRPIQGRRNVGKADKSLRQYNLSKKFLPVIRPVR